MANMLKRITTPSIDKNKKNKKMMTKGTIQEVKQQPFYSKTIPKKTTCKKKRRISQLPWLQANQNKY